VTVFRRVEKWTQSEVESECRKCFFYRVGFGMLKVNSKLSRSQPINVATRLVQCPHITKTFRRSKLVVLSMHNPNILRWVTHASKTACALCTL